MPVAGGPNTLGESNLVFAYDTGDVKNSYIGEPTTNLVSNKIVGDYGNAPGSSTTTISPDGTNNATIPIPDAIADRYEEAITGGTYSTGTQLTYSWHYKQLSTHAGSTPNELGGLYITGLVNCTLVGSKTKVADLPNDWTRWQATFQITDGSLVTRIRLYFGYVIGIGGSSAAYYGHQLEQKSHVTPFTTGTRSATQGLLPLIGNSTLDLTNVSFDSNAQMVFDGTNDYVSLGSTLTFTESYTVEFVFKTTINDVRLIYGKYSGTGADFWTGIISNGKLNYSFGSPSKQDITSTNSVNDGLWKICQCTYNKSANSIYLYINGVLNSSATGIPSTVTEPSGNLKLGTFGDNGGFYFPGNINVFKIYNRALSAAEVQQNYQQYKTRFNLS